jgi:hypothetical protein
MGVYKFSEAGTFVEPRTLYKSMLAGNEAFTIPGDYELIESAVLTSAQSSVVFDVSSFASIYKHLQIRYAARGTLTATSDPVVIRVNGITAESYAHHQLLGNGSVVESAAGTSTTALRIGRLTAATATANSFAAGVIDILDPYSSTKNTTFRGLSGNTSTGDNIVALYSGLFNNTAAVNSLNLFAFSGGSWAAGSRFSIYGIRG